MRATPTAGLLLFAGVLVGCARAGLDAPVRGTPPPPTSASPPAPGPTGDASPEDVAAAVADAQARVRAIDDATTCDFHTPSAEIKRRQMEQKQQAAQRELDEP